MIAALNRQPSWLSLSVLVISAFLLRAAVFSFYVQHEERYCQPDTLDYHHCALSMALGSGMSRLDSKDPIFWRTPGYPLYLSIFYRLHGIWGPKLFQNKNAVHMALWFQILLSSFIPLVLFFLSFLLTQSLPIAWITSWISVFHLGLVFASTFLLTEGLSLIFFYLFLLFFYRSFKPDCWARSIFWAAFFLVVATWIRPMGTFVATLASLIILAFSKKQWKLTTKKLLLFWIVFAIGTGAWYIRNYRLTGHWFFCPIPGPVLNSFTGPKVLRDITGKDLESCLRVMVRQGMIETEKEKKTVAGTGKAVSREIACANVTWPFIMQHPWYALYEWMHEVLKATFDLYSSQHLVAFAANNFKSDPIEEFLGEKTANCLYRQPMPIFMRLICWIELLFALALWFGLFGGVWVFWIRPIIKRFKVPQTIKNTGLMWLMVAPMIAIVLGLTGGFGYARLRLPIEPLLIILSLTFWLWFIEQKR